MLNSRRQISDIGRDEITFSGAPDPSGSARIGGHVSLGNKPGETISRLREEGFDRLQIHATSPRQWRTPEVREDRDRVIHEACDAHSLALYIHAIYLLNFASPEDAIFEKSIASLTSSLHAASRVGASAVTFHLGSHRGQGFEKSLTRIVFGLEAVLEQASDGPELLLENSAGAGDCVGRSFQELGRIVDALGSRPRVGICLDSAHAFAVGYDVRANSGVAAMLEEIDHYVGLERMRLIHLNDSQADLGSSRDRHANIGDGCIGVDGFRNLLQFDDVRSRPLILETPNPERRSDELKLLRTLLDETKRVAA